MRRAREARFGPRIGGLSREFHAYVYVTDVEDTEYLALVLGERRPTSRCWCACRRPACCATCSARRRHEGHPATVPLRMIEEAGKGILLYVFPRGRASLVDDFQSRSPAAPADASGKASHDRAARLRSGRAGAGAPRRAQDPPADQQPAPHRRRRGYGLEIVECVPIRPPAKVLPLRERRRQEVGMSRAASKVVVSQVAGDHARGELQRSGRRFAIVAARFNDFIVDKLIEGAREALRRSGRRRRARRAVPLPGRDGAAGAGPARGRPRAASSGIACLGAVIRGATPHFDLVVGEAARGIGALGGRGARRWRSACSPATRSSRRSSARAPQGRQPRLRRRDGGDRDGRSLRQPAPAGPRGWRWRPTSRRRS